MRSAHGSHKIILTIFNTSKQLARNFFSFSGTIRLFVIRLFPITRSPLRGPTFAAYTYILFLYHFTRFRDIIFTRVRDADASSFLTRLTPI